MEQREYQAALNHRALQAWGEDAQLQMVIEEAAELIQALCKLKRKKHSGISDQVIEELVDVEIMLDQLKNMCIVRDPTSAARYDAATTKKLARLKQRLDEWEANR